MFRIRRQGSPREFIVVQPPAVFQSGQLAKRSKFAMRPPSTINISSSKHLTLLASLKYVAPSPVIYSRAPARVVKHHQPLHHLRYFCQSKHSRREDTKDQTTDGTVRDLVIRRKLERRNNFRWILFIAAYIAWESGTGYYLGYYKGRIRNAHNGYAWLPWDDDQIEEDEPEVQSRLTENGYKPLGKPFEIRVLTIHPGKDGEPITCSLKHRDLRSKISYEALSYVWGHSKNTYQITCDAVLMEVGESLFTALQALRRDDGERVVWIDALCIDQSNNKEKSQQVRIMNEIYHRARKVIIWLGNDPRTKSSISGILEEARHEERRSLLVKDRWGSNPWDPVIHGIFGHPFLFKIWLVVRDTLYDIVYPVKTVTDGKEKWTPESWDAETWNSVMFVFSHPWFHRVWCIQELVLARSPVIMSGDLTVPWDEFATAGIRARRKLMLHKVEQQHVKSLDHLEILQDMRLARRRNRRRDTHSLIQLLFLTRGFQATDPRDRLFALIGLASDVKSSDWEIIPNYELSVAEVYHRFGLWYITRNRNFEIFSFGLDRDVQPLPGLENLPTWVPDLTRSDRAEQLPKLDYLSVDYVDFRYDTMREFEIRKKNFREARKVYHADMRFPSWALGFRALYDPPRIAFSNEGNVIHLVGTEIGKIKRVGKQLEEVDAGIPQVRGNVSSIAAQSLAQASQWLYDTWDLVAVNAQVEPQRIPPSVFEAAWKTMICEMTSDGMAIITRRYADASKTVYESYLCRVLAKRQAALTASSTSDTLSRVQSDIGAQLDKEKAPNPASEPGEDENDDFQKGKKEAMIGLSTRVWYRSRRFGITHDDNFAAVPKATKAGDIICIFSGGRVPYVLRPSKSGRYELVGECYVHGMMRGEYKEKFPGGKFEKNFAIR